jgi:hypothetical protein
VNGRVRLGEIRLGLAAAINSFVTHNFPLARLASNREDKPGFACQGLCTGNITPSKLSSFPVTNSSVGKDEDVSSEIQASAGIAGSCKEQRTASELNIKFHVSFGRSFRSR